MRWFLDTEFNEDGRTIELIALAVVSEDGKHEREWVSSEFADAACNEWVRENVLVHYRDEPRVHRARIAYELRELVLGGWSYEGGGDKPEFWAYFADYDWVALCQLYGPMIKLPRGFPFWCRDLKQLMEDRGIEEEELPVQGRGAHRALDDARWVRDGYLWIREHA